MTSAKVALKPKQIAAIEHELDMLKWKVAGDLANCDSTYVQTILESQQVLEMDEQGPVMAGVLPVCWRAEFTMLAVSNILNDNELGQEFMPDRYAWMNASYYRVNPVYAFLLMVLIQYRVALRALESQCIGVSQVNSADKREELDKLWAKCKRELIARHFRVESRVSVDG